MAIEFRRGTEAQRLMLSGGSGPYDKPVAGEPLWVTDTEKFYIGDGTGGTTGGIFIGPITGLSQLAGTAHTHDYSAITLTSHTHNYVAQYTSPIFDRITATSLTTTGTSVRTTSLYVTGNSIVTGTSTVLGSTTFGKSGDIGYQINFLDASSSILYVDTPNKFFIFGHDISSPSVSATNYYCGSTNLASMMGGTFGGTIDASQVTGGTMPASRVSGGTFGAGTTFTFPSNVVVTNAAGLVVNGDNIYINNLGENTSGGLWISGGSGQFYYTNTLKKWVMKSSGGTADSPLYVEGAITGTSVSATNFYCGSTNLASVFAASVPTTSLAASAITNTSGYPNSPPLFFGTSSGNSVFRFGNHLFIDNSLTTGATVPDGTNPSIFFQRTGTTQWGLDVRTGSTYDLVLTRYNSGGNFRIDQGELQVAGVVAITGSTTIKNNLIVTGSVSANTLSANTLYSGTNLLENVLSPSGHTHAYSTITSTGHSHGAADITGGTFGGAITGSSISAGTIYSTGNISVGVDGSNNSRIYFNNDVNTNISYSIGDGQMNFTKPIWMGAATYFGNDGTTHKETKWYLNTQSLCGSSSIHFCYNGDLDYNIIKSNTAHTRVDITPKLYTPELTATTISASTITATTYSGITPAMLSGGPANNVIGSFPMYFGNSSGNSCVGFKNHLFLDNSYTYGSASANTALYFQLTGATKWGVEADQSTGNFKLTRVAGGGSYNFANTNVIVDNGVIASFISAATYTGITMTKGITIPDPRANENITMFYLDRGVVFTKAISVVSGSSSPTVTWHLVSGLTRTGTTGIIHSATTATMDSSSHTISNVVVPASTWVMFTTTNTGGTLNEFHLTVQYKET